MRKESDRYCIRTRQGSNPAPFVHRRGRGSQAASDFHYIDLFAKEAARLINLAPMREHPRLYHACNKPATVVQPRQQVPVQSDRPANVLRARRHRRRLHICMACTSCLHHTLYEACTVSTSHAWHKRYRIILPVRQRVRGAIQVLVRAGQNRGGELKLGVGAHVAVVVRYVQD